MADEIDDWSFLGTLGYRLDELPHDFGIPEEMPVLPASGFDPFLYGPPADPRDPTPDAEAHEPLPPHYGDDLAPHLGFGSPTLPLLGPTYAMPSEPGFDNPLLPEQGIEYPPAEPEFVAGVPVDVGGGVLVSGALSRPPWWPAWAQNPKFLSGVGIVFVIIVAAALVGMNRDGGDSVVTAPGATESSSVDGGPADGSSTGDNSNAEEHEPDRSDDTTQGQEPPADAGAAGAIEPAMQDSDAAPAAGDSDGEADETDALDGADGQTLDQDQAAEEATTLIGDGMFALPTDSFQADSDSSPSLLSFVGGDSTLSVSGADLINSAAGMLVLNKEHVDEINSGNLLTCDAPADVFHVVCSKPALALGVGEHFVVSFEVGELGSPNGRATLNVAFDDGDLSNNITATPPFDADPFAGTDTIYTLLFGPDQADRSYVNKKTGAVPLERPTAAFWVVFPNENRAVFIVPLTELGSGDTRFRRITTYSEGLRSEPPAGDNAGFDLMGLGDSPEMTPILGLPDGIVFNAPQGSFATGTPRFLDLASASDELVADRIERFVERLNAALAAGNADVFLLGLHPIVLINEGVDTCRDAFAGPLGTAISYKVTGPPVPTSLGGLPGYTVPVRVHYPGDVAVDGQIVLLDAGDGTMGWVVTCQAQ